MYIPKIPLCFFAFSFAAGLAVQGQTITTNFQQGVSPDGSFSHEATYLREGQDDNNLNGEDFIVGYNGAGTALRLRAVLAWDLNEGFDPGLTFEDISLTLTVGSGSSDAIVMDIFELTPGGDVNNTFSESEATWNNYAAGTPWNTEGGDFGSTVLSSADSTGSTSTGDKVTFESTSAFLAAAQSAYDDGRVFQFIIVSQTEFTAELMRFDDNTSSAADRPLLSVTAIPEPSTYAAIFALSALGLVILRRRKALRK